MLVATLEIWPGGDIGRRHVIGTANIANESQLAEDSTYSYWIDNEHELGPCGTLQHRRSDGAWTLVRKVLENSGY